MKSFLSLSNLEPLIYVDFGFRVLGPNYTEIITLYFVLYFVHLGRTGGRGRKGDQFDSEHGCGWGAWISKKKRGKNDKPKCGIFQSSMSSSLSHSFSETFNLAFLPGTCISFFACPSSLPRFTSSSSSSS